MKILDIAIKGVKKEDAHDILESAIMATTRAYGHHRSKIVPSTDGNWHVQIFDVTQKEIDEALKMNKIRSLTEQLTGIKFEATVIDAPEPDRFVGIA